MTYLSEYKKDKIRRERQRNIDLIIIAVSLLVLFALLIFTHKVVNQRTEEAIRLDKIKANLKTCPNRVVYDDKKCPYVYVKGKKVFLELKGCEV